VIPSTRTAERRKHSALPDFLRRTLWLAGVVAGIPLLLLADAAGAAEVRTYYVACGGSENVAQLVPIDAVRTKALDTRKSPPTFAAAFSFPANTDNIATHLGEVAQMLRIASIPGCESSMRIAGHGGDIIYPRPANLSPYLDTAEARRQQHWSHAEVRYLQERGQGDVITTTDARFTDPGWPLYAVGMVLFFSARNGERELAEKLRAACVQNEALFRASVAEALRNIEANTRKAAVTGVAIVLRDVELPPYDPAATLAFVIHNSSEKTWLLSGLSIQVIGCSPIPDVRTVKAGAPVRQIELRAHVEPEQGSVQLTPQQFVYAPNATDFFRLRLTATPGWEYHAAIEAKQAAIPEFNESMVRSAEFWLYMPAII